MVLEGQADRQPPPRHAVPKSRPYSKMMFNMNYNRDETRKKLHAKFRVLYMSIKSHSDILLHVSHPLRLNVEAPRLHAVLFASIVTDQFANISVFSHSIHPITPFQPFTP